MPKEFAGAKVELKWKKPLPSIDKIIALSPKIFHNACAPIVKNAKYAASGPSLASGEMLPSDKRVRIMTGNYMGSIMHRTMIKDKTIEVEIGVGMESRSYAKFIEHRTGNITQAMREEFEGTVEYINKGMKLLIERM
uniref:Uncharacterized protein n=1 Tax=viral metagenome TaxID=1070528 RepID=A0A6M3J196_9ZZZZ